MTSHARKKMLLCSASNFILRQFHKNMLRPDSDHLEDEIFSSTDLMKQATPVQNEQQRSIEAQRETWSVFSDKEFVSEHSLQLEQASKSLGKFCQIQSVCVFSANPRAGQQVAVVIDALSDFSNEKIRTRIAERCPDAFLAIIQPSKPSATAATPSASHAPAATVHLLSPGGPVVRSMCLTMTMAACSSVASEASSTAAGGPAAFPAMVRDGRTVIVRAEGGGWREEVRA